MSASPPLKPEALTCRDFVVPNLTTGGWYADLHSVVEQKTFTDGRILVRGDKIRRLPKKRSDYLLHYTPDLPIAVVEAKAAYKLPEDGLQQAKEYAQVLGLSFAYATNGHGIVEHDYTTGLETELASFPSPAALWPFVLQRHGHRR